MEVLAGLLIFAEREKSTLLLALLLQLSLQPFLLLVIIAHLLILSFLLRLLLRLVLLHFDSLFWSSFLSRR